MPNFRLILTFTFLILVACKGQSNSLEAKNVFVNTDTTKQFKKEIKAYHNGHLDFFYLLKKSEGRQLGLDSLEKGFNNLQIRVWYDFSFSSKENLVVVTNTNTGWTASVYKLQVNWDGHSKTIKSKEIRQVTPKSGWTSFSNKLIDLKVLTLPNQDDIAGYDGGADGDTYSVEVATKNQYRFYGYWEPQQYQDKIWQAKNMTSILKLFKDELDVD